MNIDWSKAPEGATHYNYRAHGSPKWYMLNNGGWFYWSDSDNGWRESGNGERFFKSLTTISNRQWTGQGLPPVGTVCEVDGEKVVIVAHHCNGIHAIYAESISDGLLYYGDPNEFRPIRTPGQIAAEEREAAIDEMSRDSNFIGFPNRILLGGLYDAGYRKQEQPK